MDSALEVLKLRLLLQRLDEVSNVNLHARVIREAELAAAAARREGYPLLLFPCLFEEQVHAALKQEQRWGAQYWHACLRSADQTECAQAPHQQIR